MTETVEAATCVDIGVGCIHSCCISLLYSRHRSPYGAKKTCFAVCHTFGAAREVRSSEGSVPKLVGGVVAVLEGLFVSNLQMAIIKQLTRNGRCGTRC